MSADVKMSQTVVGSILSSPVYIKSTIDLSPSIVRPGPPTRTKGQGSELAVEKFQF